MDEEIVNETNANPYHKPERLQWLLGEYEKHLARFETSRKSMDQKAIWALATATSFVGFLSLAKGEAIGATIYLRFTNQVVDIGSSQKIMMLVAMLFVLTYLVLLIKVISVYFPKKVIDPFMPINYVNVIPVSAFDDTEEHRKIGKIYWDFAMDTYIKPTDIEHYHDILRECSDIIMEQYLQNQKTGEELRSSFRLLPFMAIMTVLLFVLG
ncbi:MAG: hypothetical protein OXG02_04790 [Chloroflexi bacterium]|nr:hypothetical protein [Chloroflexota bacterium]